MDWPVVVVQWLHVVLGIFWFGGTLFANLVVIPAIMTLPNDRQVPVFNAIAAKGDRVLPWVAAAAILLGMLRGTVLGPIKDVADLSSTYGILWLVGLVAALATWAWAYLPIRRLARRFARASAQWSGVGEPPAELVALGNRLRLVALVELLGFLVIFTTMVLMRFAVEA